MLSTQKDNTTLPLKVSLRKKALQRCSNPIVLEAFGGYGHIFRACYQEIAEGVVMESNPSKVRVLAVQRPTWAVYEGDAERLLAAGVGAHLPVNFLDVDPYGSPFASIAGFFGSDRPFPGEVHIVVNDGLRRSAQLNVGWKVKELAELVEEFGNSNVCKRYLEVAREKVRRLVGVAGYELAEWMGYYCGSGECVTHYHAVLRK